MRWTAEIDHDDDRGNGQPIADDGEGPCHRGLRVKTKPQIEQQSSKWATSGKQRPFAAVRTLVQPAPKRVLINFECEGVIQNSVSLTCDDAFGIASSTHSSDASADISSQPAPSPSGDAASTVPGSDGALHEARTRMRSRSLSCGGSMRFSSDNHEVVHVLPDLVGRPSDFFNEGSPCRFRSTPGENWAVQQRRAGSRRVSEISGAGTLPLPLSRYVTTEGFRGIQDTAVSYRMAGSFVLYLTERFGLAAVLRFFRDGTRGEPLSAIEDRLQATFGLRLEEAEAAWLTMLRL